MLSHILQKPKSWVLAHGEYEPTPQETESLHHLTARILRGYPLPYILGHWEFFGRTYTVTPAVLIPRPETELLVETALQHITKWPHPRILDVGTGSGVIAISLAAACPSARVTALDLSWPALKIAQGNAQHHGQTHIQFLQADLLTPLQGKFDLICANLPYIPIDVVQQLPVSKWEPRLALDGGEDGMAAIKTLLQHAKDRLATPGVLLIEIEAGQGQALLSAAQHHFPRATCRLHQDLAGHSRLIEVQTA